MYRTRLDLSGVLAVGLSQSGRTEEIVETLAWAAGCGARTLAITNGAGSPLAEAADLALVTEAGVERAVPATKTFTTQLAALAVLGIGLAGDAEGATVPAVGGTAGGRPAGGGPRGAAPLDAGELRAVPDEIERLLAARSDLEPIISGLAGVEGAVVSGRGFASSAALELALKLKEACYLHAMGLSFADLLHGPIAVVGRRTPAIIMAADAGPTLDGAVALAGRVPAGGRHRVRHRRRCCPGRGMRVRAARATAAGMARPDRPHHRRPAPDRGAGPPPRHQPRQPPRPQQGHPDQLSTLTQACSGTTSLRRH